MAGFPPSAHWRDSARHPRFFLIDARAAFPLLLFVIHIRWWTFIVAVLSIIFFGLLERFGFTVPVFLRVIRGYIAGPRKVSVSWWKQ